VGKRDGEEGRTSWGEGREICGGGIGMGGGKKEGGERLYLVARLI